MLAPKLRADSAQAISRFISDTVQQAGTKGVVIGISGGIDSAVVAALAVKGLGHGKVLGVHMPGAHAQASDTEDARAVAKALGIEMREIPVTEAARALSSHLGEADRAEIGNITARQRMVVLYHIARREQRLVLGTGNKSELLTGYFTKWGDGGSDILPIGDLYKTQVRELARQLKIPDSIIEKTPTAGLWPGQTDEGDLGISYEVLDRILFGIELGLDDGEIARRAEADIAEARRIRALVGATRHKRRMPLVPKMGVRTVGMDWRE